MKKSLVIKKNYDSRQLNLVDCETEASLCLSRDKIAIVFSMKPKQAVLVRKWLDGWLKRLGKVKV